MISMLLLRLALFFFVVATMGVAFLAPPPGQSHDEPEA